MASKRIGLVLLISLMLRLGWAMAQPTSMSAIQALPDQVEYLSLAQNLLHGHGLSFVDPRFSDRVYAFRTPGYPLLLVACGANVRAARAAQALLDTSTVLAVYLLARRVMPGDTWRPIIAAGMVALNPLLIYFCGLLLSETLFTAMLVWGMFLLMVGFDPMRSDRNGTSDSERVGAIPYLALGGGVLLALAVLVRPSAAGFPVVLGVGAVIANRRRAGAYQLFLNPGAAARSLWLVSITMLLLVFLTLTPWALRNLRVLHHPIWTDTNAGITLYDSYNTDATGASDQSFVQKMPFLREMNEIDRSKYLAERAREFASQHPGRVMELMVTKAVRTWSPIPLSGQFGRMFYRAALLSYAAPFDLLVLWGLWKGKLRSLDKLFLVLPAIYLTVVHAVTVGSLRYRVPAEPALAVLAACALRTDARTPCRDSA